MQEDEARRILATAPPDPVGERVVLGDAGLTFDRTPAVSDHEAAANPEVAQEHASAGELVLALAELVARHHNQLTDAWEDLPPTVEKLQRLIALPIADLPHHLVALHQASVLAGGLLAQNQALKQHPETDEKPLPADLERRLANAVAALAVMLRRFPSVVARDDRLRDFMRPVDLPAAQTIASKAEQQRILPPEDLDLLRDILRGARLPGSQGEKSGGRLLATVRNILIIAASALLAPAFVNESPYMQRVGTWLSDTVEETAIVTAGMAADVGAAICYAAEKAAENPNAAEPKADPPAPPTPPRFPPLTPLARWRETIPGLPADICPEMITIPAGRFLMGTPETEEDSDDNERPQREVTVAQPFALGRCAVSFAEWDAAIAAGAKLSSLKDNGWGRGDHPVINVLWKEAQAYCDWLNTRLALNGLYRLPSEAEWEYACRAGTITPFSFGPSIISDQANYDGRATYGGGRKGEYRRRTVPVGSLPANPWGLHEMHGNVWEWVQDAFGPYLATPSNSDALQRADASLRVVCGGTWVIHPRSVRAGYRDGDTAGARNASVGFRVARTLF